MSRFFVFAACGYLLFGSAMSAADTDLSDVLPEQICREVVGADYRPGVDVRGGAVVGAELEQGAKIAPPQEVEIPISVDLAARFGWSGSGLDAAASIGTLTLRSGAFYWNDERLDANARAQIKRACRDQQDETPANAQPSDAAQPVTD